jgi:hypothetical protein
MVSPDNGRIKIIEIKVFNTLTIVKLTAARGQTGIGVEECD